MGLCVRVGHPDFFGTGFGVFRSCTVD